MNPTSYTSIRAASTTSRTPFPSTSPFESQGRLASRLAWSWRTSWASMELMTPLQVVSP